MREGLEVLGQQIKTSTKLTENSLCDKLATNTSSIVETSIYYNVSHAHIGKICRLCGESFDIESYNDTRMYCPDCEKALGELITWWGIVNPIISKFEDRTTINPKKDRE